MKQAGLEHYAAIFDQAVALNAKSLIVLMVLPFAGFAATVFYPSHRPFVTHVVFSLHFYSFLLLLLSASLTVVEIDQLSGGSGLKSADFDHILVHSRSSGVRGLPLHGDSNRLWGTGAFPRF